MLKKNFPKIWIDRAQYIHSILLSRWILNRGSEPLIFSQKSVMVFSPHQDDETFGCGGMIALKRELGIPVAVVFLTDGHGCGGSKPRSKEEIIQIRKQEATTALKILGVESSEIHFLAKSDGNLRFLETEERQQTILEIVELLKHYTPEEIYVPHYQDCHQDHEVTYELVKEAISQIKINIELLQYPIWLFWQSPLFIKLKLQDITAAYRLSIGTVQNKKNKAIASYSSQLENLPSGFVKLFSGTEEIFFKVNQIHH
jgi:N-acetylglucosamine malate deacetylase 1